MENTGEHTKANKKINLIIDILSHRSALPNELGRTNQFLVIAMNFIYFRDMKMA